ncbi:MAG TPA: RNA methyltransferase, partial [Lacipirellulaceae bacterium]|nr:RNA methyltransferase [Lacipirellulaceae bacterium]
RDKLPPTNYNSIRTCKTLGSPLLHIMPEFAHQRHKPPRELVRPRELVVVCAPMRSNVNLSRIARVAGCCGVTRMICCGPARLDRKIARDAADFIKVESHRTLPPTMESLRGENYHLVGLEQTTNSKDLHQFHFARRTALVIGNERTGLTDDILRQLDDVVEIPVWGLPYSYNAATATAMALYEYCRQYPDG